MAPVLASEAVPGGDAPRLATRLPSFAPKDLQQCEEGCYWRWLVHTLLEDVGSLKYTLEETQEELQLRAEQRREIEEVIGNRDRVLYELESMSRAMETLRVEVPQKREHHGALQKELESLQQRQRDLQDKQEDLRGAIKRSTDWQKANQKKEAILRRDTDEGATLEKALVETIDATKKEIQRLDMENKSLAAERDALRIEVQALEDAKGTRKKAGKAKKPGKAKTKN
jgi:chromosome segregation ATPase